jgi:DNA-directed RNA polymerase subunit RPC12/RpoP
MRRSFERVAVECAVCGKQFSRGILDLRRHMNATTLQHLFSETMGGDYKFQCPRCGLYFTKEDHLTSHNMFSSCKDPSGNEVVANNTVSFQGVLTNQEFSHEEKLCEEPMITDFKDESILSPHSDTGRTMECMVCGKLFPRGPIDLHRHATAVTLKHLIAKKKMNGFPYGCDRCGLHFTSMEHLKMHENHSTCNPEFVWPENAATMAGLRAIHRSDLHKPVTIAVAASSSSSSSHHYQHPSNTPMRSSISIAVMSPHTTTNSTITAGIATATTTAILTASSTSRIQEDISNSSSSNQHSRKRSPETIIMNENNDGNNREKRAKVIIPEGTMNINQYYKYYTYNNNPS